MNGTDSNIVTKAMTGSELVRTGQNACKEWIRPGKSNTISATRSTEPLSAGKTYPFSAYVNTSQCTSFSGKGVYLQVTGRGRRRLGEAERDFYSGSERDIHGGDL